MRVLIFLATVSSAAAGHAQDKPERWQLVEELRIGSLDGANSLTGVQDLLVSRDSREVLVGQHREHLIRVFDAESGQLVRTIGRLGQGPGEFNAMGQMGWKEDTLVVADRVLRRLALFTPRGQHLRTERVATAVIPGSGVAKAFAFLANGTALGRTTDDAHSALLGQEQTARWVLMSQDGQLLRTLAQRQVRDRYGQFQVGNRGKMFAQPISETVFVDVDPEGSTLVILKATPTAAPDAHFQLARLRATGDTIYNRSYRYTPRPLSAALVEETYRRLEEGLTDVPPARLRAAVKAAVKLPPALPPVTSVLVNGNGTVWLNLAELEGDVATWTALDPAGNIEAFVRGPRGLNVRAVTETAVWGTISDELDIPYVVRYRLQGEK